jgi:RNA methyltransferase, TrmH family
VATRVGTRSERLGRVRDLRTARGRREQRCFAFEGETLLEEARAAGIPIAELYATQAAYDTSALVRRLDAAGIATYLVDEAAARSISDLETPSGIVAVAPIRERTLDELFELGQRVLVLADTNDPANAGTLLRSADAFGWREVIFGRLAVDPFHPKVVRGSMGAIFRLAVAIATPPEVAQAALAAGFRVLGLAADGRPIVEETWDSPTVLLVGNERHGLGAWERLCQALVAIPMSGPAESLSAAVAGSIALYEASRGLR